MDGHQLQHLQAAEHHILFLELEIAREQQLTARQADEIVRLKLELKDAQGRAQ
jgi:hypothetical protein